MNYEVVCQYIRNNNAKPDDDLFRLAHSDGKTYIERWKYPFEQPTEEQLARIDATGTKAAMEQDRFENTWWYPFVVKLIDERIKRAKLLGLL